MSATPVSNVPLPFSAKSENNVPVKEGEFKTGYIIRITTDNNQLFYLKVK